MRIGIVKGLICPERQRDFLREYSLALVQSGLEELVALNPLAAKVGDRVLLLTGQGADRIDPAVPCDASVVAVLPPEHST